MKNKKHKSWATLASESKANRKRKLTQAQIEKSNKIFEVLLSELRKSESA